MTLRNAASHRPETILSTVRRIGLRPLSGSISTVLRSHLPLTTPSLSLYSRDPHVVEKKREKKKERKEEKYKFRVVCRSELTQRYLDRSLWPPGERSSPLFKLRPEKSGRGCSLGSRAICGDKDRARRDAIVRGRENGGRIRIWRWRERVKGRGDVARGCAWRRVDVKKGIKFKLLVSLRASETLRGGVIKKKKGRKIWKDDVSS